MAGQRRRSWPVLSAAASALWVIGLAGVPDNLRTWREEWLPMLDFLSINHLGALSLATIALLWSDERWDYVNRLREWRARRQVPEGLTATGNLSIAYRRDPPAPSVGGWIGRERAIRILARAPFLTEEDRGRRKSRARLLLQDFLKAHSEGANFSTEMISKGLLLWWISKEEERRAEDGSENLPPRRSASRTERN